MRAQKLGEQNLTRQRPCGYLNFVLAPPLITPDPSSLHDADTWMQNVVNHRNPFYPLHPSKINSTPPTIHLHNTTGATENTGAVPGVQIAPSRQKIGGTRPDSPAMSSRTTIGGRGHSAGVYQDTPAQACTSCPNAIINTTTTTQPTHRHARKKHPCNLPLHMLPHLEGVLAYPYPTCYFWRHGWVLSPCFDGWPTPVDSGSPRITDG